MHQMFSLLEVQSGIRNAPHAKHLDFKGGTISFENVTFGYVPERLILNGASFTVEAGKSVAIVGRSGSDTQVKRTLEVRSFKLLS
ncbi:unnamed protein product [Calypogeia fissa]